MNRRKFVLLASLAPFAAHPALANARANTDAWPTRPVTLIVPWPAGGGTDGIARTVASHLQERLGQSFVISNRPGASGIIGSEAGAKAESDGYTLVLGVTNTHAINPTFFRELRYDPVKDFEPVALLATGPHIVLVNSNLPVKNLGEFVAYAKKRQGTLNYGSYGNGSTAHLITELFKSETGLDMVHVPYKGIPPAIVDLIGEQIVLLVSTTGAAMPQIEAGRLRAIAVLDKQRMAALPDVPTMTEQGFKNADYLHWYGLLAPATTPKPLIDRISKEIKAVLEKPELKTAFETYGVNAAYMDPKEFSSFIRSEKSRWGEMVELAGVKAD